MEISILLIWCIDNSLNDNLDTTIATELIKLKEKLSPEIME